MQEDFDKLRELLERTKNRYSIRFLGNTTLGNCWSCSFKPFWDNSNRQTIFDRELKDLIPRVCGILSEDAAIQEGSMRDEIGAA